MRIKEIREFRDAPQFKPFTLCLADGRAITVHGRDFLMASPSGRTVIVYRLDDLFDVVDVMLVTSLHVDAPNSRVKRKSSGK